MNEQTINDAGAQSSLPNMDIRPAGPGRSAIPHTTAVADAAATDPADQWGATIADRGAAAGSGGWSGPQQFAASSDDRAAALPTTGTQYQIVRTIGRGGMGEVLLAWDRRTRRWVAIKQLALQFARDPQLLARFSAEAQSNARLSHYHIVALYHVTEDEGAPSFVMEFVAGPRLEGAHGHHSDHSSPLHSNQPLPADLPNDAVDLERLVRVSGNLDVPQTVRLGAKLCSALSYAHRKGVIHRDVKPANVLMTEELEPKLTDFGLARLASIGEDDDASDEGLTLAGARLLSLGYGAPEQETDASRADARADVYGLGGTLWFALTGQNPRFFRESEVPAPLRPVLSKALAKDRESRFQSIDELAAALEAVAATVTRPLSSGGVIESGFAASTRTDGALTACTCIGCGRAQWVNPAEPTSRRFCDTCGVSLFENCLGCDGENAVGTKFCIRCGVETAKIVRERIEALSADRARIFARLQESDFVPAIEWLESMSMVEHPRLKEFRDWANEMLAEARESFETSQIDRAARVAKAEQALTTRDYTAAATQLDGIPVPLHTPEIAERLEGARKLQAECTTLHEEIRWHVTSKVIEGLKAKLLRFIELKPQDADARKLLSQLIDREAREDDRAWRTATEAATLIAYRAYLDQRPDGKHVEEIRRLAAPLLRAQLLVGHSGASLRQLYLACRTDRLRAEDEKHSLLGVLATFGIRGACGGCILAAIVGGISWWVGALFGGFLGGLFAGILTASRKAMASWIGEQWQAIKKDNPAPSLDPSTVQQPRNNADVVAFWVIVSTLALLVIGGYFYFQYATLPSAIGAAFLGMFTGTLGGALAGRMQGQHLEKAKFGPLPWFEYARDPKVLGEKFVI